MLKLYLNMLREHGLLTTFLKIQQVETVQRKFTKRLPGYASLCYKERMSRIDLESLEMRRLRHALLYTYKIVFNLVSEAANDMFNLANTLYSTRTRGTLLTLCIQLELEAIRIVYTFITVLLMYENIFFVNVLSLPGTICLRHQNTFKYLVM